MNFSSAIYLTSAAVLITAFYIQGQRYLISAIRGQLVQSTIIAAIAFILAYTENSIDLLILGILLFFLRGVLITYLLAARVPMKKAYYFESGINVPYLFLVDLVFMVVSVFILYYYGNRKQEHCEQNKGIFLFHITYNLCECDPP